MRGKRTRQQRDLQRRQDGPAVPRPGMSEERRYNASFDDRPDAYDDLRASGHMARRRGDFFLEVVDQTPGQVVELGCGTGTLLRHLAGARPDRSFVGVDPLADYVEFARERARAEGAQNLRFEVGTGETLGSVVPPAGADLVISVDALHHVDDLDRVVEQVTRAAAPGARWVAMEPNRLHPYVLAYHVLTPGERTFAVRDFLRRVEHAGWRLRDRRNLFLFPSGVARVPAWAARWETRLERFPPISGGIALDLCRS